MASMPQFLALVATKPEVQGVRAQIGGAQALSAMSKCGLLDTREAIGVGPLRGHVHRYTCDISCPRLATRGGIPAACEGRMTANPALANEIAVGQRIVQSHLDKAIAEVRIFILSVGPIQSRDRLRTGGHHCPFRHALA